VAAVEPSVDPGVARLLDEVSRLARASGAFASVERAGSRVVCTARTRPEASFRAVADAGAWFIEWASPDRYLSQSIEAELMWTGDDLDDLIGEELADEGFPGSLGGVEHFRDAEKSFVFRARVPAAAPAAADIVKALRAFDKAFVNLGGMKPEEE
jgi:hypothetical protein